MSPAAGSRGGTLSLSDPWGRDRTCEFVPRTCRIWVECLARGESRRSRRLSSSSPARWELRHADAVGDTRTITLHHVHTDEDLTITYKRTAQYDEEALKKINWIMRDWRKNEAITMDRQEIDLLWEVYQEVGAKEPIEIICGYRSPATNACCAAAARAWRETASTRSARPSTSTSPAFRSRRSAPPRCGCRAAASATTRPRARRSSISTSATSAPGRA